MIVVDANILVSAVLGQNVRAQLQSLEAAGLELAVPRPQIEEAHHVVAHKLALSAETTETLSDLCSKLRILEADDFVPAEERARARLHGRGQIDWPVLAAALAFDAGIWSNDRDLFGVGAPVWSTRNVRFAP